MIEHRINDEAVDSSDVGFTLIIKNPFLNLEEDGSATYTFTIPATDKVRRVCKFIHRLQGIKEDAEFNWKSFFASRKFLDGTAVISEADEKNYEVAVGAGKGDFYYKIKDKKLTDLQYEDVVMGTTTQDVLNFMHAACYYQYPDRDFNFPMIEIPEFYGPLNESNPGFKGIINYYRYYHGFIPNEITINNGIVDINNNSVIPFAYLLNVLRKVFNDFDYTIDGQIFIHPELIKCLIFNNYALDFKQKRYYYTFNYYWQSWTWRNNDTFVALRPHDVFENIDNCRDPSTHYYTVTAEGVHAVSGYFVFSLYPISMTSDATVRVMLDNDILETIEFSINGIRIKYEINGNYVFESNDIGKKVWLDVKVNSPPSLNSGTATLDNSRMSIYNQSESELNRLAKSLNLKNHLPEIKINDFLKALTVGFGAFFFYNHKMKSCTVKLAGEIFSDAEIIDFKSNIITPVSLKFSKSNRYKLNFDFGNNEDLLTDNFLSLDEYVFKGSVIVPSECSGDDGDYFIVKNLNCIYLRYLEDYVSAFREYSDNYYDLIIGDGEEEKEVKIGFSPLFMKLSESWYGEGVESCLIPYTKIKGTSPAYPTGKNPFDLRLMIFHGLQNNSHAELYPFASSSNYDFSGNKIGNLALNLTAEDGIFEIFLRPYYDFLLNMVEAECERILSPKELEDLNVSKKHDLFSNFFINTIEVAIDKTGQFRSKITMAKRKN